MKPRTKLQREVAELFEDLPPLQPRQEAWAWEKLFDHTAYRNGTNCWCSECGHIFERQGGELLEAMGQTTCNCPKCGHSLKVEKSKRQKDEISYYFTTLITWHGLQVVRHFIAKRIALRGNAPIRWIREVAQIWINEQGQEAIVGRPNKPMSRYYDAWDFSKPMRLTKRKYYCYRPDKYDIFAPIAPAGGILARIRRNGYTQKCEVMAPDKIMRAILTDTRPETLIKQKQWSCLQYFFTDGSGGSYGVFRQRINICTRHGYIIKSAGDWVDMLQMQEELGIDTRNPKNICPHRLKEAHDKVLAEHRRWREKRDAERRSRDSTLRERWYQRKKGAYIGIGFTDGKIRAYVIPSVFEMEKEGKAMGHCVFSSRYDERDTSLIFSVRDVKGRRLATVELDLTTMQILQCRAKNNGTPENDSEIRSLITRNLPRIAEARKLVS